MYIYNWGILPYIRNKHNIVNQLYFDKIFLKKEKREMESCNTQPVETGFFQFSECIWY